MRSSRKPPSKRPNDGLSFQVKVNLPIGVVLRRMANKLPVEKHEPEKQFVHFKAYRRNGFRFTDEQVIEMRRAVRKGLKTVADLHREHGGSYAWMQNVINGICYAHIIDPEEFA